MNRVRIFAIEAHGDQKRKYSGEPYWHHPMRVAAAVEAHGMGFTCIAAAWLHDVVEDTPVGLDVISAEFGLEVARLVQELTKVSCHEDGNRETRKALDRAFLNKASADAQTIKCFDIMDNMADIWKNDPDFAVRYAREKIELLDVMTKADVEPRAAAYKVCKK